MEPDESSRGSTASASFADTYSVVMCIRGKPRVRAVCSIPFRLSLSSTVSQKHSWKSGCATFEKVLYYLLAGRHANSRLQENYLANVKNVDLKKTTFWLLKDIDQEIVTGVAVEGRSCVSEIIEIAGGSHKVICLEMKPPDEYKADEAIGGDDDMDVVAGYNPDLAGGGDGYSPTTLVDPPKERANLNDVLNAASCAQAAVTSYPPLKVKHSGDKKDTLNLKERLYNTVVAYFVENKLAFRADECAKIGVDIVNCITSLLWEVDGHELRVFPPLNRFSTVSTLPSGLASIKNYAALAWVIEDGSKKTEAHGFHFNTRWKLYNGAKPRCESKNLTTAKSAIERVTTSHWFTCKKKRSQVNDKWDLLLRALTSAETTLGVEIDKMKVKALVQSDYVKDIKDKVRVKNASPTCTVYEIPVVSSHVNPRGSSIKLQWTTECKTLLDVLDTAGPFDVVDPMTVLDAEYILGLTRAKKHTLFMTHFAINGIPEKTCQLLPSCPKLF